MIENVEYLNIEYINIYAFSSECILSYIFNMLNNVYNTQHSKLKLINEKP